MIAFLRFWVRGSGGSFHFSSGAAGCDGSSSVLLLRLSHLFPSAAADWEPAADTFDFSSQKAEFSMCSLNCASCACVLLHFSLKHLGTIKCCDCASHRNHVHATFFLYTDQTSGFLVTRMTRALPGFSKAVCLLNYCCFYSFVLVFCIYSWKPLLEPQPSLLTWRRRLTSLSSTSSNGSWDASASSVALPHVAGNNLILQSSYL